ncbi:MAG: Do family serine endopeptidase [Pseudohongiellaceae bacterium]
MLKQFPRVFVYLSLVLALAGTVSLVHAISPEAAARGLPSLAPMLEETTPAVVNIRVTRRTAARAMRFFDSNGRNFEFDFEFDNRGNRNNQGDREMPDEMRRFFFDGREMPDELRRFFEDLPEPNRRQEDYQTRGSGSGVIVDAAQGYVITNHHVVNGADTIDVQLNDNRSFEAELVGSDARTDIALLKIEADDLVDISFADIETVQVGDYVVAIGSPFGLGQTVTSGIVSALGRAGLNNNNYENYIQTDAAINVGNSGGALIDLEGNLIGINTVIISGSGGSHGVGFAVPADMVSSVMEHLERDGEVRRGILGVTITNLTPDVAEALDVSVDSGALVTGIIPGSAAEEAGLEVSDVIVELNDREIQTSRDLRNLVGLEREGEEVELVLYRDGDRMTVDATIGAADGQARAGGASRNARESRELSESSELREFRGANLRSINPVENPAGVSGVLVTRVSPQGRSLREGDIITAVNRTTVANLAELNSAVEDAGRVAALTVIREGRQLLLVIQ